MTASQKTIDSSKQTRRSLASKIRFERKSSRPDGKVQEAKKEWKKARTAWARAMTKQRKARVTRKRSVYRDIILDASTILPCVAASWPGFPSKIVVRSRSRRVLTQKLQITDVHGGEKSLALRRKERVISHGGRGSTRRSSLARKKESRIDGKGRARWRTIETVRAGRSGTEPGWEREERIVRGERKTDELCFYQHANKASVHRTVCQLTPERINCLLLTTIRHGGW